MRRSLSSYCYLAIVLAFSAQAADYKLLWEAPTENTDGTPAESIKHYQVFWSGLEPASPLANSTTTLGPVEEFAVTLPGVGCRTFGVKAVDVLDRVSKMSNTVEHCTESVPLEVPSAPTNLIITWTETPPGPTPFFVSNVVTQPTVLANRIPFSQDKGRYTLVFTLNTLGTEHGLVSKDETNQNDPGHTSLWVDSAGQVVLRHQGPAGVTVPVIKGGQVVARQEHTLELAWSEGEYMRITLDGQIIGNISAANVYGMANTSMDTILGGTCISCVIGTSAPTTLPIRGQVQLTVWDQ